MLVVPWWGEVHSALEGKQSMKDITSKNFGLLIAYIIPGIVVLRGLEDVLTSFGLRLSAPGQPVDGAAIATVTVGGFLNETLLALAVGMTVSTLRWVVVDTAHHFTGINRPLWDDSKLQANLQAFDALVENHYRYYQFYSNMFVGLLVIYAARPPQSVALNILFVVLLIVFFAASRDALTKYYRRAVLLLDRHERNPGMTNGHRTHQEKQTAASESSANELKKSDNPIERLQPSHTSAQDTASSPDTKKSEQ